MRRALLPALALPLLLFPGRTTLAAWTDPSPAQATATLTALTLTAPTLVCKDVGASAVVTWTASTTPTTLSYSAVIVEDRRGPLEIESDGLTRRVTVGLNQLLNTLTGEFVTLRVTGSLPETSWTTSSDTRLYVGAAGVGVRCA